MASHDHVVELIQRSRELLRMTVVSSTITNIPSSCSTITKLTSNQFIQRQYATLPRKGNNSIIFGGTLGRSHAPLPPRRDPKTTLSIGRTRATSMVAGLGKFFGVVHVVIFLLLIALTIQPLENMLPNGPSLEYILPKSIRQTPEGY